MFRSSGIASRFTNLEVIARIDTSDQLRSKTMSRLLQAVRAAPDRLVCWLDPQPHPLPPLSGVAFANVLVFCAASCRQRLPR
jgi:hypothetical protein